MCTNPAILMNRAEFETYRAEEISGRYLPPDTLDGILQTLSGDLKITRAGESAKGLPIHKVELGHGPIRVLMWSQMHGNESTTTKAVLDMMRFFLSGSMEAENLKRQLTLEILPMLNPDGSLAYTRENANGTDLNRDAANQKEPESKVLRACYEEFRPDFCLNLHDQRTIYNLGASPIPATLSFLAPAADTDRGLPGNRKRSMELIAAIAHDLRDVLPGGIGRYDDSFNPNCVGDQFQMAGTPTLLFEAGHFPGDYQREHTRFFVFRALLSCLRRIADSSYRSFSTSDYLSLPANGKLLADLRIRNAGHLFPHYDKGEVLAVQYREVLRDGRIHWVPVWPEEGLTEGRFGHREWDAARESDREEIAKTPGLLRLLEKGRTP